MNTATHPAVFRFLERFYLIRTEGTRVQINGGTLVAVAALLLTLLGSSYRLVVVPMQEDLRDHEIRVRALEISDGRTGVHLENLTESIERLIDKIEVSN
jgi:hypothetical protein